MHAGLLILRSPRYKGKKRLIAQFTASLNKGPNKTSAKTPSTTSLCVKVPAFASTYIPIPSTNTKNAKITAPTSARPASKLMQYRSRNVPDLSCCPFLNVVSGLVFVTVHSHGLIANEYFVQTFAQTMQEIGAGVNPIIPSRDNCIP